MLLRTCASLLLAGGLAHSQTDVNLSGSVKSARTGEALVGAVVKLAGTSLTTTTTSTGSFQLSGVTAVAPRDRGTAETPVGIVTVRHRQLEDGPVVVRLMDLSGRQVRQLHAGTLPKGDWLLTPPPLPGGFHFLRIESGNRVEIVRILGGADRRGSASAFSIAPAPQSGDASPAGRALATAETLMVTHPGTVPAHLPLSSLQQSGFAVSLEDSAGTSADDATIVPDPSWPCFQPDGIPPPKSGTAVFSITLQIGGIRKVGLTRFGQRIQYDIKGGSVTGDRLSATVVSGGLDYDLVLSNGSREIEQIVILKAGSTPILMRNAGVAPVGVGNARMVLDFEAPNSSAYTWLHTGKFAATRILDTVAKTIHMDVYDISNSVLPATRIQVKDPAGAENQSWDCPVQSGGQGTSVLTETVTLASSVSIGASKRGSRNIIPITGGTTSGRVVGKILDGGADYQLGGLDARYTLAPDDGEYIIVRNCGSGTLYPVFEARVAGPYNFLNQNKYVSSSPGIINGGVSITFYEKK